MINCWCAGSEKIFGYNAEEIMGKHIGIIFTEEDKENGIPQQEMVDALKTGKASDNRWHLAKDGKLFYAYGQMFPINDREDNLIGFVKILRDLTERKMAEDAFRKKMRELEELNSHKDTILAILSHDLRSPLGSIIEITEYLKNSIDEIEPEEVKKMLEVLNQSSTTELEMLDSLLEWARIKYASEAFSPSLCNLRNAVSKVYDHLSELASAQMVKLANEVNDSILVFADKKMLISIIQNLVSNSIKFTGSGGKITVSASSHDSKITVQVHDTGIGMSADQLSKLFTPQVKTLSQARKEEKGAGIGLLLVKNFLEKNRGEIWVKSTKGKGSSFFFTLPVNEETQQVFTAESLQFGEGG